MSKLMTRLALVFFGWTLETYTYRITTFFTSPLVLINMPGIKTFLVIVVVWRYWLSVACIILVTGWSGFQKRLLLLVFACFEFCVLVSHNINLCHLRVACHLLVMSGGCLWTFHLFSKLPDLACWKPIQVYVAVIDSFSSSLRKN